MSAVGRAPGVLRDERRVVVVAVRPRKQMLQRLDDRVVAALGGFVPKVADIKGAAAWGTAAFHLLEGFAFAAYHAWGQTLP